jgi:aspartyl-tRNA synthetase
MTYDEAMERFGHDAPDLRFGMEIVDCTDLAKQAEFRVFRGTADGGGRVRGINAKGPPPSTRGGIDELTEYVKQDFGAKGLAWFRVEAGRQAVVAHRQELQRRAARPVRRAHGRRAGRPVAVRRRSVRSHLQGAQRPAQAAGRELKLYDPKAMSFSWVVEFPMFEWDEEEQRWAAMHHPFTAPRRRTWRCWRPTRASAAPRRTTW